MKKAILALGLIAGTLCATSAVAQDRYGYGNGYGYRDNYQQYDRGDYRGYDRGQANACGGDRGVRLEQRIDNQARRGDIDWRTARQLHAMVDRTENLQRRYCSYGMNYSGAREVDRRYDQIEARLRVDDRDGWRR
jgi:hypothetical protein